MVSRERRRDLSLLAYLPVYPLYAFVMRISVGFFIIKEMLFKSHLDSAMAPFWVLRKGYH
jgi:hypothetical protein